MNHAPRTGMSGEIGELRVRLGADGQPVPGSMYVDPVAAIECDFWLCTCRADADNADHFFGPTVSA